MKKTPGNFLYAFVVLMLMANSQNVLGQETKIFSPDKNLCMTVLLNNGTLSYNVAFKNETTIESSPLGLVAENTDLSKDLAWIGTSKQIQFKDSYRMVNAKKSQITYIATEQTIQLKNKDGKKMNMVFRVSDNGVAFRYFFPDEKDGIAKVLSENTKYVFSKNARAWLQPMSVAKSGWEHTNPSYEEHYIQDVPVGTFSPTGAGWVYPALFKTNNVWMLISEAAMDGTWCATRLQNDSGSNVYNVSFPDARETISDDGLLPSGSGAWFSPWRIVAIGDLAAVATSTLGTDLAAAAINVDRTIIKPGKSSWSWIMSKDDYIVYDEQVKYINFAADMGWQYCLVDAGWDQKIGYDKMKELSAYAASKGVALILWYNSAGNWNTVKYTPKDKLLTAALREAEFTKLNEMGIKGVKIDFFGGDGRSIIQYYHDILKDAARHKLLVNFHGATLPRGLARTYPNLLTAEAVGGFEMVTFSQKDADQEANHICMLPFTRNAFDPMDFTPMNLYKVQSNVKRKTTSGFELATSIMLLSGIQHYAESPEGMSHVPGFVKAFVKGVPAYWDDVKFIQGSPGKDVVMARRSGKKWFIAGMNGEKITKNLTLDLSFLPNKNLQLITDGEEPLTFMQSHLKSSAAIQITVKPNGGFVMVTNDQ